ncbi:MAG: hypothetical protein A4E65_02299 [Syntrophorhabdus sp. PtaU1.Bin153]|nr:MAG: hypothetical protein A4E65_02299 [Syntrophorhabdus sp. PtaU1.Bin153]
MKTTRHEQPGKRPKPTPKPQNQAAKTQPPKHAVTIGQVSGLKLIEKDGSWNITVNVQREKVPANIEQWAFQHVAVAVMEDLKAAEKAMEEDIFSNGGT